MNRRLLSTAAAAAALALAPTVAMADTIDDDPYFGHEEYVIMAPEAVEPGEPFEIVLEGPETNASFWISIESEDVEDSDIEIAGYQEASEPTTAGVSVFEVTLHEEAVYGVTVVNSDDETVDAFEIVVGDPAAGDGAGDGGAAGGNDDAAAGGQLPDTGSSSTPLVLGAAALLAAGAGVLVFARRQQA